MRGLVRLEVREPLEDRLVGTEEEAAGAARRVADAVVGAGPHHVDDGRDQRPRREVLAGPASTLLGGLLNQTLVGVALQVGVEAQPLVAVDELFDEPLQLRRVLHPVAGLAENHGQHVVARAELFEDRAVVVLQVETRAPQQRWPVQPAWHHSLAAELFVLLVGHLQEQQVGELFKVLPVRQPVISQNVAEVPEPLHQSVPDQRSCSRPPARRVGRPRRCDAADKHRGRLVLGILR